MPTPSAQRHSRAAVGGVLLIRPLYTDCATGDADVTLIDRHTFNTFQPLLYQVASRDIRCR
jgi:NADH dehydrogenase